MKFLSKSKDGGPDSNVTGYFLVEIKCLFTIVLLRFAPGSREAYHSHAFNAWSWVFKRALTEYPIACGPTYLWPGRWLYTPRERCHKVYNRHTVPVWAISFRGPWVARWTEVIPATGETYELTHGRKRVS